MTTTYIYTDTDPITLPCSLARSGNKNKLKPTKISEEHTITNSKVLSQTKTLVNQNSG